MVGRVRPKLALDRDYFATWLKSQGEQIVGKSNRPCECPIYRFINHIGYKATAVKIYGWDSEQPTPQDYAYATLVNDGIHELPHWAYRFIMALDTHASVPFEVTASTALKILEELDD